MVCFLAGIGTLSAGIYFTYAYVVEFGPEVAWKQLLWPLVFGLAGLVLGFLLLLGFLAYRRQAIEVYKTGLVYRRGRRKETWKWDEVEHLFEKITRKPAFPFRVQGQHRYRLTGPSRRPLILDDRIDQVELLADRLRKARFSTLYASRAAAYNEGDTILFGPVSLNKVGITLGGRGYGWDKIAPGRIDQGYLVFPLNQGSAEAAAHILTEQVPDMDVLVALLTYAGYWQR